MNDRLSEIKARWNVSPTSGGTAQFIYADEDVRWLIMDLERLRLENKWLRRAMDDGEGHPFRGSRDDV